VRVLNLQSALDNMDTRLTWTFHLVSDFQSLCGKSARETFPLC